MRHIPPHIEVMHDWREKGFHCLQWKCSFPHLPKAKVGHGMTPEIAWIRLFMDNGLYHPLLYPENKL
jgi:hypothetical protein